MAINPYMVLDFAQNLGQQKPLTQLGSRMSEIGGQALQQKQMRDARESYNTAFEAYRESPNQETGLALTQAAIPLGMGQETMAAIQMYGQQDQGGMSEEALAQLRSDRRQVLAALTEDPTNTRLQTSLLDYGQRLGTVDTDSKIIDRLLAGVEGGEEGSRPLPPYVVEAFNAWKEDKSDPDLQANLRGAEAQAVSAGNTDLSGYAEDLISGYTAGATSGETASPGTESFNERYDTLAEQYRTTLDPVERDRIGGEWLQLSQGMGPDAFKQTESMMERYDSSLESIQQQQAEQAFDASVETLLEIDPETSPGQYASANVAMLQQARRAGIDPNNRDAVTTAINASQRRLRQKRIAQNWQTLEQDPLNTELQTQFLSSLPPDQVSEMRAEVEALEKNERRRVGQELVSVAAPLSTDNPDEAVETLENLIAAYEAGSNNEDTIEDLRSYKDRIESGDGEAVLAELAVEGSFFGEETIKSFDRMGERREQLRREIATDADIARIMAGNDFTNPEYRRQAGDWAEGLGRSAAADMIRGMAIVDESGGPENMTTPEVINLARAVANDLDKDVLKYRSAMDSADTILSLQGMSPDDIQSQGMVDQAFVTAYSLLLDPNSAVREGEANRMLQAQGLLQRLATLPENIREGQILQEGAIDTIIETSRVLKDFYNERVDTYEKRTREFVDFMDPDGSIGVEDMVFLPRSDTNDSQESDTSATGNLPPPTPTNTGGTEEGEEDMVFQ